jgi:hypothetical protein
MRHARVSLSVAMLMLAGASPAGAADPAALLRKCEQVKVDRWDGVTHYVVVQSMMGQQVALPYERFEASGPDGQRWPGFRPMVADSPLSSPQLKDFARGARSVGDGLSNEMAASGLPVGMLGSGGEPWASPDPSVMMGGAATFLEAGAAAQDANQRERDAAVAEASAAAAASQDLARRMRHVGIEPVEGVSTQHLRAQGLGQRHPTGDGGEMVIQDLDLWIDDRNCVPMKFTMAGTHTSGGKTQPVTIERVNSQYRAVPGSKMYEPFRQVMRIQGAMTEAQQQELRESQAKLEDLERRLAQMPPSQRDMIIQRMGPQMETMKRMASGGGIEVVMDVQQILVNPDDEALRRVQLSAAASSLGGTGAMSTMPVAATSAPAPGGVAPVAAPPAAGQAVDQSAYKACLQQKIEQRQSAQQKKQAMGRLLGAAGRIAGRFGGDAVTQLIGDAQTTTATADDLAAVARDLGLTEDEIAACRSGG